MRCLCILLAVSVENAEYGQVSLHRLRERLVYPAFPVTDALFLFAEVEMERDYRGQPILMRAELLHIDRADPPVELTSATGVVQMPMNKQLPPIFTMNHELAFTFPEPGVYQVTVYLNDEVAAHRLIAAVEATPQTR